MSLKRQNCSKDGQHTFDIVGYTHEEGRKYIESLWEPWMNWKNHGKGRGKWTIDHIVPRSSFNFKNPDGLTNWEEVRKCWALSNLQPMEWYENCCVKIDKLDYTKTK
jgi:hypothetical protein